MMTRAIVLGCGRVGKTLAKDLAGDPDIDVTVADLSAENLRKLAGVPRVTTLQADLSDTARLQATIRDYDVVLGALPGCLGFQTLRAVIEAGKPYCDISFMPEDALTLDALAKRHSVTAVVDCGVSPGLSNLIIGHVHGELDETENAAIYVGGLPKLRCWPYQYKAPFAPADVIEVYTRPTRIVENGQVVVRPALSEPELISFPRVGTLEAVNTDGLRTLLKTVQIPNMNEKTLRYPGHCELMRVLRETGFFDKSEIDVNGVKVRPLDVTSKLLFSSWTYGEGEEDFTILRVVVEGRKGGRNVRYTYDLYDEYDRATGTSSMARTTAFPSAIVARKIARGEFTEPGVFPLECLPDLKRLFDQVLNELKVRGVILTERIDGS